LSLPLIFYDYSFLISDRFPIFIDTYFLEKAIESVTVLVKTADQDIRKGLQKVRQQLDKQNIAPEYKYYVYLFGLFPDQKTRCIFDYWKPNQDHFVRMIKMDKELGLDYLLQAFAHFFEAQEDQRKFAPSMLKYLIDLEFYTEDLFINWYEGKHKLPSGSGISSSDQEDKFRVTLKDVYVYFR